MRLCACLGLAMAMLASCSSGKDGRDTLWPPKPGTPAVNPSTSPPGATRTNAAAARVRYPRITPLKFVQGRVTQVNARLRFVVVDFGFNPLPRVGQVLRLMRNETAVGELRVSGPFSGSTAIADITQGEAAPGDDAQEFKPQP